MANLICAGCNVEKNEEKFDHLRRPKRIRQRTSRCKICRKKDSRAAYLENREKIIADAKRYRMSPKGQKVQQTHSRDYAERKPKELRWGGLVQRAKKKGFGVMSRAEFYAWFEIQTKACEYCGMDEAACRAIFKRRLAIDRKDNKLGYVVGNIALACWRCNMVKSAFLTSEQMMIVATMFFRPKVVA